MTPSNSRRESRPFVGAGLVLPILAVIVLGFSLWPDPRAVLSGALVFVLFAAVVASVHRPTDEGRGLALGAAALPVAALEAGPAAAGAVALGAWLAAAALRAGPLGGGGAPLRRWPGQAAIVTVAAIGGATLVELWPFDDPARAGVASGFAYLALLLIGDGLRSWLETGRRVAAVRRIVAEPIGLAFEAFGFAAGAILVGVAADRGIRSALLLLGLFAALAAEAARQRWLRQRAEVRGDAMERLDEAGRRLAGGESTSLPETVLRECRQVLEISWFHFELLAPDSPPASWRAGPDGKLRPGAPQPPANPRALPGIHRRADWHVLERRLEAGGDTLAALRIWIDPRRLEERSIGLFDRLLPQLTALVHRSVLDQQASQDGLTGASLRRVMDRRLPASFERSCELGGSLALVLVDLDHFKAVNDNHGHAAGDEALIAVARVLAGHLREGDVCARWGGEEFALLLEGLDGAAAQRIAERLRLEVEALDISFEGRRLPLTLSAGVTAFPEIHCREPAEIIQLADEALYEAKAAGRNCCMLHRGRGRFVDPQGRQRGDGWGKPIEAPRLFS